MKKLLLIGLVAASSLFAIEDGTYTCVATKMCNKDGVCQKLVIKTAPTIMFSVTDNGRTLEDATSKYPYKISYEGFDVFSNSKYSIMMPSDDVGSELFDAGMIEKKTGMQVYMSCLKQR